MTYKKILVPVDGSPTAERGLKEAMRLARGQKARLHLVHVMDGHLLALAGAHGAAIADMLPELEKSSRRTLDKAIARVRAQGLPCSGALLETFTGPVAPSIVREARKWRADLVVIGTHGRRGLRRAVMGSDAEEVVRASTVPVLLVRARGKAAASR